MSREENARSIAENLLKSSLILDLAHVRHDGVLVGPNYKGKGRPFGAGKTLGDVSVPLT